MLFLVTFFMYLKLKSKNHPEKEKLSKIFLLNIKIFFTILVLNLYFFLIDFLYVTSCINQINDTNFFSHGFLLLTVSVLIGYIAIIIDFKKKKF